jgi:phage shock protein A
MNQHIQPQQAIEDAERTLDKTGQTGRDAVAQIRLFQGRIRVAAAQ